MRCLMYASHHCNNHFDIFVIKCSPWSINPHILIKQCWSMTHIAWFSFFSLLQLRPMMGLQSCSQGWEDHPGMLLSVLISITFLLFNPPSLFKFKKMQPYFILFQLIPPHMMVYTFNIWLIEFMYVWFTSILMLCLDCDCLVYTIT